MPPDSSPPADDSRSTGDAAPGHPAVRRTVLILALCWLSLLIWMAVTSGNPTVLNAVQILSADSIVTAQVSDGQVTDILHVWRGTAPDGPVVLPDRQGTRGRSSGRVTIPDGRYIVPLTRSGHRFIVTRTPVPARRHIYPLTADTQRQLETLIGHAADPVHSAVQPPE